MSGEPLRVGIAGYGIVGSRRRMFIDANPLFQTVAVSDIKFEEETVGPDGVEHVRTYDRLFEKNLDVLFVSLPNDLAAEATIAGLERGLHVFCEKPPGTSVEEIRAVRRVESQHPHLKLKYGFNHRYHQSVKEAKEVIEGGQYGRVVNVRGVYGKSRIIPFEGGWRSERAVAGGGILLDQGIHMLDMIRYFAGDFTEVKSFVSNAYWGHDVEDNAFALMRSHDGCVAMVHSSATQWRHKFRLEIALEEALVELTGILSGSKSYGEERLTIVTRDDDSVHGSFREHVALYLDDNSWRDEVGEFAEIIRSNRSVDSGSSEDALRMMELVYRIYYSDEEWRDQWDIPDPTAEHDDP